MDPIEKRELKRQAFQRLAAQRRRAGLLRGRVVAISLVCFALLWGIVFAQMATGNDPVLAPKEQALAAAVAKSKRVHRQAHREAREAKEARAEAAATEAEFVEPEEEEFTEVEAEPQFEEAEAEPEAEFEEVEPEFVEEPEPLVTSQS